ncbi:MAG: hypothetical protein ACEPOZ_07195 [Marinifilaceae bacterium]
MEKYLKEEFIVGDYEFSFDRTESTIEIEGNQIIDLTIKGKEEVFEKYSENDNFEFDWGLYPPEFYARGIDLNSRGQFEINQTNLYDYEVALYFMEHNDVEINLSVMENWILISGWTNIGGKQYPLEIKIKK